jgi:anti-sigma B factor antagonist
MDLVIDIREHAGYPVVAVHGELDMATVPSLQHRLHGLVDGGANQIVVDLGGVGFIDSTGAAALVGVLKRVRSNDGDLQLVCGPSPVHTVLRMTGLERVFSVHESVEGATAGAAGHGVRTLDPA